MNVVNVNIHNYVIIPNTRKIERLQLLGYNLSMNPYFMGYN